MKFKVGDKVKCIHPGQYVNSKGKRLVVCLGLKNGGIYTVKGLCGNDQIFLEETNLAPYADRFELAEENTSDPDIGKRCTWSTNLKPGDRLRCINSNSSDAYITEGNYYTVKSVTNDKTCLRLEENDKYLISKTRFELIARAADVKPESNIHAVNQVNKKLLL